MVDGGDKGDSASWATELQLLPEKLITLIITNQSAKEKIKQPLMRVLLTL